MSQQYRYPSSASVSITAEGTNGAPIPSESLLVGGENPSGNLEPLQVDSSGNLLVSLAAEPGAPLDVNVAKYGGTVTSLGQKASAASQPVVIASDQSAVPVSDTTTHTDLSTINTTLGSPFQAGGNIGNTSFIATQATGTNLHTVVDNFPATQPISGTVTADQGGTWSVTSVQPTGSNLHVQVDAGAAIIGKVGIDQTTPGTTNGVQVNAALPAGTNLLGKVGIDQTTPGTTNAVSIADIGANAVLTGNGVTGTGSLRVTLASDTSSNTNAFLVKQNIGATSTITSVASSATNVSLLALNANRTGATLYNDSTQTAFVKLGTTASSTSYTVQMVAGAYYELPFQNKMYTGEIDAIWASANGNMRITEFT